MRSRNKTLKKHRGGDTIPTIHIVYFTYFDIKDATFQTSRSQKLILEQMNDLKNSGLAEAAKSVHIVLSNSKASDFNNQTEKRLDEAKATIHSVLHMAEIHRSPGNRFEYPGIRLVWDIAKKVPAEESKNTLILYFHSKGMNNGNVSRVKTGENEILTKTVITPWREIVERFKSDPAVEKAGYAASEAGFMWFNFWWARASYLAGCPRPILTERRHYYEDWLGRRNRDSNTRPEPGNFTPPNNALSLCVDGPKGPLGISISPSMEKCKHT